jgi:amidase
MACYANETTKPEEETILVGILAKLGAVFYVKTTTPTAMMMMETINHVWGETSGAYHSGTSPGGVSVPFEILFLELCLHWSIAI